MVDYLARLPILAAFQELEFPGGDTNRGECICPAHDDGTKKGKKSLHVKVKEEDGKAKVLLNCLAGCSSQQIVAALGMQMADLFEKRPNDRPSHKSGKQKSTIVKVYDYRDAGNNLLHQTVRHEPKRFTQWAMSTEGQVIKVGTKEYKAWHSRDGWKISTLAGIEPVPYRLPQLLAANEHMPIFLCEGEKDADRLAALKLVATTIPMGTGKWRNSYNQYFTGQKVVIVPDYDRPRKGATSPDDNPGMNGAKKIAKKLFGIAKMVAILQIPDLKGKLTPKYDISDFIDAVSSDPAAQRNAIIDLVKACPVIESTKDPQLQPAGADSSPASLAAGNGSAAGNPPASPGRPEGEPADEEPGPAGPIANCFEEGEGDFKPYSMRQIIDQFKKKCDGFPKRVGQKLFFCDRSEETDDGSFPVQYLMYSSSLFGWAGNYTGQPPAFMRSAGAHPKDEVFRELQRTADGYEGIERFPHYPERSEIYYACKSPDGWKSKRPGCLQELISMFSPATEVDSHLMLAMFLTMLWGGDGGRRPLFVITSDSGQGAGKTTFAELMASIVGGTLNLSVDSDSETLTQRLLSPEGTRSRVVLLDNVKSWRFSWSPLEANVTASHISGKEMYVGESRRPNLMTYIVTINGPSFSTDLAQRAIAIKLDRPIHDAAWYRRVSKFVADYRDSLIAEGIEMLKAAKRGLKSHTRWADWEDNVLSALDPDIVAEVQRTIRKRQTELDAEKEESQAIQEYFESQLERNNLPPETSRVLISNETVMEWLNAALGQRHNKTVAMRILSQLVNQGKVTNLTKTKHPERVDGQTTKTRGFWWQGIRWSKETGSSFRPPHLETHLFDEYFGSET